MASKRHQSSQLTKDDYDRGDEGGPDSTVDPVQTASADVLKTRKMAKPKSRLGGTPRDPSSTGSLFSQMNPGAPSFQPPASGLSSSGLFGAASQPAAPKASNPFAGFAGFGSQPAAPAASPAKPAGGFGVPTTPPTPANPFAGLGAIPSTTPSGKPPAPLFGNGAPPAPTFTFGGQSATPAAPAALKDSGTSNMFGAPSSTPAAPSSTFKPSVPSAGLFGSNSNSTTTTTNNASALTPAKHSFGTAPKANNDGVSYPELKSDNMFGKPSTQPAQQSSFSSAFGSSTSKPPTLNAPASTASEVSYPKLSGFSPNSSTSQPSSPPALTNGTSAKSPSSGLTASVDIEVPSAPSHFTAAQKEEYTRLYKIRALNHSILSALKASDEYGDYREAFKTYASIYEGIVGEAHGTKHKHDDSNATSPANKKSKTEEAPKDAASLFGNFVDKAVSAPKASAKLAEKPVFGFKPPTGGSNASSAPGVKLADKPAFEFKPPTASTPAASGGHPALASKPKFEFKPPTASAPAAGAEHPALASKPKFEFKPPTASAPAASGEHPALANKPKFEFKPPTASAPTTGAEHPALASKPKFEFKPPTASAPATSAGHPALASKPMFEFKPPGATGDTPSTDTGAKLAAKPLFGFNPPAAATPAPEKPTSTLFGNNVTPPVSKTSESSPASSSKKSEVFGGGTSVFSQPSAPSSGGGLFQNLKPKFGAEKDLDEDDGPSSPKKDASAGKSLFDRVDPPKPAFGSTFGQPAGGSAAPSSAFGQPSAASEATKPAEGGLFGRISEPPKAPAFTFGASTSGATSSTTSASGPAFSFASPATGVKGGNNTWTVGSPIKFGAPSAGSTPAVPAATSNIFGGAGSTASSGGGIFGNQPPSSGSSSIFSSQQSSQGGGTGGFSFTSNASTAASSAPSASFSAPKTTTSTSTTTEAKATTSTDVESTEPSDEVPVAEVTDRSGKGPGEENDDVAFTTRAAVWGKSENAAEPNKKVKIGTGQLRVLVDKDTKKARVLVRIDTGRVILNVWLKKEITYRVAETMLMVPEFQREGGMKVWNVKVKDKKVAEELGAVVDRVKN